MLSVTRRSLTKEILLEKKSISVAKLAKHFDVTEETIRRDLKALESEGFLTRTYGGAFIQDGVMNDISVSVRQTAYVEAKKRMAAAAAKLIHNGDSIFIDSSTSAGFICGYIKDMRITVVTNSLYVINSLNDNDNIKLVGVGGKYDQTSMSFVGSATIDSLSRYYVDSCFISPRSISLDHGVTDPNEQQAMVHTLMLEHGNEVNLIMDHTKFNKTSFMNVGNLNQVHNLFTDTQMTHEWRELLARNQVRSYECIEE